MRRLLLLLLPGLLAAQYLITAPESLYDNGCDWLAVSHDTFTDAIAPLCRLRDSLGLAVRVAPTSLIYSTFDSGPRDQRIRTFIERVYASWQPRPEFILLVGDACKDSTRGDFVPVRLFPKFSYPYSSGLTVHGADNWYATLAGADSIPDVIIGRLPVNRPAQAESLVAKIAGYETAPDTGLWTGTTMLVASSDFVGLSTEIDTLFLRPNGDSVYTVYESQGNSTFLRHKTIAGFNQGAALLCQTTHGTQPPGWTGFRTLFSYLDADSLVNGDRAPVVLGRG